MILATAEAYQTRREPECKTKHHNQENYHKLPDTTSANDPKIMICLFLSEPI